MTVVAAIRERLAVLQPAAVEVEDESALHAGHSGAAGGGGHYRLTIVSALFAGKRTIERHRMVYDALGPLMPRQIHAMSITARTPDEIP
jgi:BolA protein